MRGDISDLSPLEQANIASMTVMTAFWFFLLGASLGSFLNVLVYRLPRGISLVRKRSSCPGCDTTIDLRDNIPLIGWLKLRGLCRHCNWHIPIRYPIVELLVALQFVILLFVEVISGGANLPVRQPEHWAGVVWTVWYLKYPDLMELYLFHSMLLYLCTAIALIDADGHKTPRGLLIFGIIAGITSIAAEPRLHPTLGLGGWWQPIELRHRMMGLTSCLQGITAGYIGFCLLRKCLLQSSTSVVRSNVFAMLLLCGLFLGGVAATMITILTLTLAAMKSVAQKKVAQLSSISHSFTLLVALHLLISFWRQLYETWKWMFSEVW